MAAGKRMGWMDLDRSTQTWRYEDYRGRVGLLRGVNRKMGEAWSRIACLLGELAGW